MSRTQQHFFRELQKLEGKRFSGKVIYMARPIEAFDGAELVIEVLKVSDTELRIPFRVGDDSSRTWVIQLNERGLQFKHDHRHEDGTPESLTNYGGWGTHYGTTHRQHFPADKETIDMLPDAATNVWTIEVRPDGAVLIYDLARDSAPRFRAEFDLTKPIK